MPQAQPRTYLIRIQAEEAIVAAKYDKEYLPITGFPDFTKHAAILAYGKDSAPLKENRIAITQSISGTGALRIGGAFLQRFYPDAKAIYLPTPTWGNHIPIFKDSGLEVKNYRYYDKKTVGLDFKGLIEDLKVRDRKFACFWVELSGWPWHRTPRLSRSYSYTHAPITRLVLIRPRTNGSKSLMLSRRRTISPSLIWRKRSVRQPLYDTEECILRYQGFASGDVDGDAFAPRYFVEQGFPIVLSQSFAKVCL